MAATNGKGFAVVVIGGSAGSLEPLQRIISGFPENLNAAVFVATHTSPASVSAVPHILSRAGALFATHALDGAPIAPGRIIIAPPDCHLTIEPGVMRVFKGPKENGARPSIDVLFRSASQAYGPATCGVLLSGALDDGVAGLRLIRENGGLAVVQDPKQAAFGDMPQHALQANAADIVRLAETIADDIKDFASNVFAQEAAAGGMPAKDEREHGTPSVFTCPDCGGTLWEAEGDILRFRCRTGHSYNSNSMLSLQRDSIEESLWSAVRVLMERVDLLHRVAQRARHRGDSRSAERLERQEEQTRDEQDRIQHVLDVLLTHQTSTGT